MTTRADFLTKVISIIDGERNETYGGPEDSFKLISEFWNNYLDKLSHRELKGHDVAVMLMLLKIARLANSDGNHEDSWLDIAGYASCGFESFKRQTETG